MIYFYDTKIEKQLMGLKKIFFQDCVKLKKHYFLNETLIFLAIFNADVIVDKSVNNSPVFPE